VVGVVVTVLGGAAVTIVTFHFRKTEDAIATVAKNVPAAPVAADGQGPPQRPAEAVPEKREEQPPSSSTMIRASARLEIAGAIAGAQVRMDGQSIGETDRNGALEHEIAPGAHTIELSKDEYTPIRVNERVRPGKTLRLDRGRVAMAKTAPKTSPPEFRPPEPKQPDSRQVEAQDWAQIANSANPDDFDSFLRNHPGGAHSEQARARAADLRQQIRARAAQQLDQSTWERLDQHNREQLQDYLSRFPAGAHAQEARQHIAELDRQASEAVAAQRLREQKEQEQARRAADEQAIVKIIRDFDAAYNKKDLPALQKLWSGISVTSLRRQFREARDLQFQLQLLGKPEVNGDSAAAICSRALSFRGQSGGVQTSNDRVKVTLVRDGSGWVIRSIDVN